MCQPLANLSELIVFYHKSSLSASVTSVCFVTFLFWISRGLCFAVMADGEVSENVIEWVM